MSISPGKFVQKYSNPNKKKKKLINPIAISSISCIIASLTFYPKKDIYNLSEANY